MEVQYLREMRQNYLMIEVEESQGQGFEARMMAGNIIEGLLKFRIKKTDNQWKFCYEITSKQPLSRLLEKTSINSVQIRTLLLGIAGTLTRMEDYLLNEGQILLNPDYIYIDPEEYQPFLCLIPGKKGDFPQEFSLLLQFLLEKVDHKDKEAVVLIYGLYRESLKENYGFDNLLRWLVNEKCPNMGYSDKGGKCETINHKKIELWETEEYQQDEDSKKSPDDWKPRPEINCVFSRKKPRYLYFLPGIALILAAGGVWFFSGSQKLVKYGFWAAATGGVLLAVTGVWWICSLVLEKRRHDIPVYPPVSCDSSSYTQFQTSFRETSFETSRHNSLISQQSSQLNKSAQPGQWQMIFEAPDEEGTEEHFVEPEAGKEEMHTVLLWNQNEDKTVRSLVSRDGEPDIVLPYYPFIIGKQEGLCDYVLNKSTVSRLHVRIDETEDGYQVTDLNSTNGTFVNGRPLDANGTTLVQPGDEIGVADLRFQLK